VGSVHPCFIIAEAGVNHNGDLGVAKELIDAAAECGADAVKFQTFNADRVVSRAAPKARYQLETTSVRESQWEMLRRLELSPAAHDALRAHCEGRHILFLSTPFDGASVDLLDRLGVPAFKVGSGEITNHPFLDYVARKGRPVILSTGMSFVSEVDEAVRVLFGAGNEQVVLLHCVSNYPADPADANLRAMLTMREAFRVPVGFSDHTLGADIAIAAVALGACVLEKHLTLDRNLEGPDHRASMEVDEFASMVKSVRIVERALGHGRKEPVASELEIARVARRSLVAASDLRAGTRLTSEMVDLRRPGTGLPPAMLPYVVGRTLRVDVRAGDLLRLELFA